MQDVTQGQNKASLNLEFSFPKQVTKKILFDYLLRAGRGGRTDELMSFPRALI